MREVAFIKQNKQKWLDFETSLFGNVKKNPDELADLFMHLTNDLAYAQTYYPKSKTINYLNDLTARAFHKIYRSRKTGLARVKFFFQYDLPMVLYRNRIYMLAAFIIFIFFVAMGVFSSIKDPSYPNQVLGDAYIDMTSENIKNGKPLNVYADSPPFEMFLQIGLNNLRVTIQVFTSGILLGLGSIYYAYQNGVMLGSFQYFFHTKGLLWQSALGIWMHGSFEIFSIVIALMSGLVLGGSFLFPTTYSRKISFLQGTGDAVQIYMSTIPFIIIAAFIESFITRLAGITPYIFQGLISIGTFVLIFWYYVLYPKIVYQKMKSGKIKFEED